MEREEEQTESEGDLQQACWILPKIILADAPHQVLALLHEHENPGDAENECGDDRYALGAAEDVAEATPRVEAADRVRRAGRDAAANSGEGHVAAIVCIALRPVVGEDDELARPREGSGATGADRKGCRVGLIPELAHELEPRLARRARREFERVEQEVAIAAGTAMDEAGAPLAGRRKGPGLSGRDGPDRDFPLLATGLEFRVRFPEA